MFLLIEFESTDEAGPTKVEDVKQETLRRLKKAVTSAVEHRGTWEVRGVEAFSEAYTMASTGCEPHQGASHAQAR